MNEHTDFMKQNGGLFIKGDKNPSPEDISQYMSAHNGYRIPSPDFMQFQKKNTPFRSLTLIGEAERIPMDITIPGFPEIVSFPRFLIWLETMQFLKNLMGTYIDNELSASPATKFLSQSELVLKCKQSFPIINEEIKIDTSKLKIKEAENIEIYSKITGYLSCSGNNITIYDPVVINSKKTGMIYQFFPVRTGRTDMLDNYYRVSSDHKEKYPKASVFIEKDRSLFAQSLPENHKRSVLIVSGNESETGRDAKLIIEKSSKTETLSTEEKIDFKEQTNYTVVEKGELLAKKIKAVRGCDGQDIFGESIKVKKGEDIKIAIKGPIDIIPFQDSIEYRSKVIGLFTVDNNTLILDESFVVNGNVDFSIGNIDFKGSVVINGDVLSGFKVKSEDNILILGGVEDGVEIISRKNITVKKGIFGKRTTITAGMNIQAGFVQEASLYAQENITILKYAAHSKLISERNIKILGNGLRQDRASSLFGGETYGFTKLDAHSIGSERCLTRISVGYSPIKEKKKMELESDINILNREISLISETIPEFIFRKEWERIKLLPETKKSEIKDKITQIKKYTIARTDLEKNLFALNETLYAADSQSLQILVRTTIKGDVAIMIKGYVHNQNITKNKVRYFLNSRNVIESESFSSYSGT